MVFYFFNSYANLLFFFYNITLLQDFNYILINRSISMLRTTCSTSSLLSHKCLSLSIFANPHPTRMTTKLQYNYHMSYLMDSKHDDRFVKIDRRAFHLYKDSLLNFPNQQFNEKIFLTILIDTVRTKQPYEDFQQLVEYGIKHINSFKQPISIFNFGTQLYLYNYRKNQQSYIVAKKGFQFFKTQSTMKYSSYFVMKFLIFLQKNVGLEKFSDEDYKLINFTRFKPLFLCFTLEMFYQNNLEHYGTIKQVFDLFVSSESIIPFADIHHYKMATKIIKDGRFKEFVDNLSKRLLDNHNYGEQLGLNMANKKRESNNNNVDDSIEQSDNLTMQQSGNDIFGQQQNIQKSTSNVRQQNSRVQKHQQQQQRQQIKQSRSKPQQFQQKVPSFPWQKAYSNHIYRQFSYYPSIHYFNQSNNVNTNVNAKKN